MIILDGKKHSKQIIEKISLSLNSFKNQTPGLAQVSIGCPPETVSYIRQVEKICHKIGIRSNHIIISEKSREDSVINTLRSLNQDSDVHGIILHMPLPDHLHPQNLALNINPSKDIDGINPLNVGLLCLGQPSFMPATPLAIMKLLDAYHIDLKGKKAIVIGRSNIVGKPIALMLLSRDCTVTLAHSKTQDIEKEAMEADILVVAIGKSNYINQHFIKKGAVIIDVGINVVNGKLTGDVDFDDVAPLSSYITPVPGGVGSMTTAVLLENLFTAFKAQQCL